MTTVSKDDSNVQINSYLKILRPLQWLKNLMLYFPPFLGGAILMDGVIYKGFLPFAAFCLASSATYVFNDILDREYDAHHPVKRGRPIASGALPLMPAGLLVLLLLAASLGISVLVSSQFQLLLITYLVLSAAYSLKLKHVALLDLFCIAAGFILRLEAGGVVFKIVISEWLFLSVFLLALFLSTGKRLGEKSSLGHDAALHRKSLTAYPDGFLQGALYLSGAAVLVTYTMFVISRHYLVYSVILCCFGLLRFIFRVQSGLSGDPTDSLLKDAQLFIVGLLWAVMVAWIIYR